MQMTDSNTKRPAPTNARHRCVWFFWVLCLTLIAKESLASGTSQYPIWSDLTFFERQAIGSKARAEAGDPDALLSIYLVASGVRELAEYETANKRIREFINDIAESPGEMDTPWLRGKVLNERMHSFFFPTTSEKARNGYSVDQSRLMGVFETGEYNCISSSLLYAVLLRHFDLNARGVILPSHAFIELQLPARLVEVETTSRRGYDQKHDRAFYEKNNDQWFDYRGLEPATYEDYLQRERVSLLQLAARNMLNQHTSSDRMDERDGARLAEISAFLDPGYALAQEKRLYFYNREIHRLVIKQQWDELLDLFATTYQSVLSGVNRHAGSENLQRAIHMYLSGAMLTYAQVGETELTLGTMGELLNRDWSKSDSRLELEKRVANAVGVLLQQLVQEKQFDEAQLVLSLTEGHMQNSQPWQDMTRWVYLRWAEEHWQEQRWEDVIFTLKDMQQAAAEEGRRHPLELIESAYYNWVLELTQQSELATAEGVVEQCRVQIDDQQRCEKASTLLERYQKQSRDSPDK